jgi:DNA-binding GntR family transcriptional regulator
MTEPDDQVPATRLTTLMRNAILEGALSPGQRLVEAELTARFDAKRGAVRQALIQLEGEGLVERERNRGARVRPISLPEAIEITEARAVLEGLCAAKAAENITEEGRESLREMGRRMQAAVDQGDIVSYSSMAQEIHARIRELADQATVSDLLERLRYQIVRYHFSIALLPGRPKTGLQEHLDVIEAITRGSPEEAEDVMRRHLMIVIDALCELGERPGPQPLLMNPASFDD